MGATIYVSYVQGDADAERTALIEALQKARPDFTLVTKSLPYAGSREFLRHVEEVMRDAHLALFLIGPTWSVEFIRQSGSSVITEMDEANSKGIGALPVYLGDAEVPSGVDLPVGFERLFWVTPCYFQRESDVREIAAAIDEMLADAEAQPLAGHVDVEEWRPAPSYRNDDPFENIDFAAPADEPEEEERFAAPPARLREHPDYDPAEMEDRDEAQAEHDAEYARNIDSPEGDVPPTLESVRPADDTPAAAPPAPPAAASFEVERKQPKKLLVPKEERAAVLAAHKEEQEQQARAERGFAQRSLSGAELARREKEREAESAQSQRDEEAAAEEIVPYYSESGRFGLRPSILFPSAPSEPDPSPPQTPEPGGPAAEPAALASAPPEQAAPAAAPRPAMPAPAESDSAARYVGAEFSLRSPPVPVASPSPSEAEERARREAMERERHAASAQEETGLHQRLSEREMEAISRMRAEYAAARVRQVAPPSNVDDMRTDVPPAVPVAPSTQAGYAGAAAAHYGGAPLNGALSVREMIGGVLASRGAPDRGPLYSLREDHPREVAAAASTMSRPATSSPIREETRASAPATPRAPARSGSPAPPHGMPAPKGKEPPKGSMGANIFALLSIALAVLPLFSRTVREGIYTAAEAMLAALGLKHNAITLFGLLKSKSGPPEQNAPADLVDCSVFAPPAAPPGATVMIQVFLHIPAHAERAAFQASIMDPTGTLKGPKTLDINIPRGARVGIGLECAECAIEGGNINEPVQWVVWRGEPVFVQFLLRVPDRWHGYSLFPKIRISVAGALAGFIAFSMAVEPEAAGKQSVARGDSAKRYNHAFLSYATPDRKEVLKRAQILKAAGVDFFQDILSLDPGARWEEEVYRNIDACDLFLLFWSKAARDSKWVIKEAEYALGRRGDGDVPDIVPVILEGPPPVLPPASLGTIHFNDTIALLMAVS